MAFWDKYFGRKEPEVIVDETTEAEFGDASKEYKPREAGDENETTDVEGITFTPVENKPKIKGFQKGAIYGAIGLVAFGTTMAMVMNNSDSPSSSTNNSSNSTSLGGHSSNASTAGPDLGFDSYASMSQYNTEKKIEEAVNKKEEGVQSVPPASGVNTVRQVPNRVNPGNYTATEPVSESVYAAPSAPLLSRDNPYASAIEFALGNGLGSSVSESGASVMDVSYDSYATSDRVLLTGTLVPVTLITGIDSSLDGQVTAQVRENVYDSITGSAILIPAGSRLIGTYEGGVTKGGRIGLTFTRIILPNGNSIALKDALGVDAMGFGGVKDKYSEHSGKAIGAAFVTSLLAGIAGTASDGSGSDNRSSGQEAVSEAIASVLETGQKIVEKRLDVDPTATIRPGFEFNVMLNTDLALDPY